MCLINPSCSYDPSQHLVEAHALDSFPLTSFPPVPWACALDSSDQPIRGPINPTETPNNAAEHLFGTA